jgi:hypothetical protein
LPSCPQGAENKRPDIRLRKQTTQLLLFVTRVWPYLRHQTRSPEEQHVIKEIADRESWKVVKLSEIKFGVSKHTIDPMLKEVSDLSLLISA